MWWSLLDLFQHLGLLLDGHREGFGSCVVTLDNNDSGVITAAKGQTDSNVARALVLQLDLLVSVGRSTTRRRLSRETAKAEDECCDHGNDEGDDKSCDEFVDIAIHVLHHFEPDSALQDTKDENDVPRGTVQEVPPRTERMVLPRPNDPKNQVEAAENSDEPANDLVSVIDLFPVVGPATAAVLVLLNDEAKGGNTEDRGNPGGHPVQFEPHVELPFGPRGFTLGTSEAPTKHGKHDTHGEDQPEGYDGEGTVNDEVGMAAGR